MKRNSIQKILRKPKRQDCNEFEVSPLKAFIERASDNAFAMFKYLANMLMLMNGVAAITLLNKDPKLFSPAIIAFTTGCLFSCLFYVLSFCAICDVSRETWPVKYDTAKQHFIRANAYILIAFISSMVSFYCGVVISYYRM